ncbi:hypothetical protein HDE_02266 [Halotydeus destructor]|nr:hypothetical protein HDE_02266 [Halotydeus destructor]
MRHKNYSTDGRPKYTVDDFAMTSDSPEHWIEWLLSFDDQGNICYGVFNNQFINMTHNAKSIVYPNLVKAVMFGPPLVLDFNYDEFMGPKDETTLPCTSCKRAPFVCQCPRQHGIKCAGLPLEKHLHWGRRNKCLNVDHVSMLMMDLRKLKNNTGDL